jgi:hypothetical protein
MTGEYVSQQFVLERRSSHGSHGNPSARFNTIIESIMSLNSEAETFGIMDPLSVR